MKEFEFNTMISKMKNIVDSTETEDGSEDCTIQFLESNKDQNINKILAFLIAGAMSEKDDRNKPAFVIWMSLGQIKAFKKTFPEYGEGADVVKILENMVDALQYFEHRICTHEETVQ